MMRMCLLVSCVVVVAACENKKEKQERLVQTYCGNCHLAPEPRLLPRAFWDESVLPRMGARLGFNADLFLKDVPSADLTVALSLLPAKPLISDSDWELIKSYYLTLAPENLEQANTPATDTTLQLFSPVPVTVASKHIPASTFVHAEKTSVLFGFSELYEWQAGRVTSRTTLPTPPSAYVELPDGAHFLSLVGTINPTDQPIGSIWKQNDAGTWQPWFESLQRPVDLQAGDFRNNGQHQLVVCEFGNLTGGLSVVDWSDVRAPEKKQLSALPGARKAIVTDVDGDTQLDIIALFAQGDEQVIFFKGDGQLGFTPTTWLRFPPIYGSSFLEYLDVNQDGHRDLILAQGDNADHTVMLKPYHGVRIFVNNGKNQFTESLFYPMPGASQTATADYDGDGDLDIAAISFFPDFQEKPARSFVLLFNEGTTWRATTAPYAKAGRWLVMQAHDLDADQDIDLMLGALDFNGGASDAQFQAWVAGQTPLLILRNNQVTN
jgi:hypothetical protein